MAQSARTWLGVGLLPGFVSGASTVAAAEKATATVVAPTQPATAKNIIYLYMGGGMSHLDTFDRKTGAKTAGPTKFIPTSAAGVSVSEHLPHTAKQMHHVAVINSLSSTQGAHEQGNYFMHTSYFLRGTIRHPGLGAWADLLLGGGNATLPNYVYVGGDSQHPGAGFLPASYTPLFVNNPENGLSNVQLSKGLTSDRFAARLALAGELDQEFRSTFPQRNVKAYADMYDDAVTMMKSSDLKAFDLTDEPAKSRDFYGRNPFGQGCLLARRLVERNVRFVEVSLSGWDTHTANFVKVPEQCAILDQTLAALLADLASRGLLKDTLVVLTTEFGRTPDINQNVGRDHYPQAFSALLAGGGIKGGVVYGKTDGEGRNVDSDSVEVTDFNATIATAMGLPLNKEVFSPSRRPFKVADKGKPVMKLFA